jgi:hypothetical protein
LLDLKYEPKDNKFIVDIGPINYNMANTQTISIFPFYLIKTGVTSGVSSSIKMKYSLSFVGGSPATVSPDYQSDTFQIVPKENDTISSTLDDVI